MGCHRSFATIVFIGSAPPIISNSSVKILTCDYVHTWEFWTKVSVYETTKLIRKIQAHFWKVVPANTLINWRKCRKGCDTIELNRIKFIRRLISHLFYHLFFDLICTSSSHRNRYKKKLPEERKKRGPKPQVKVPQTCYECHKTFKSAAQLQIHIRYRTTHPSIQPILFFFLSQYSIPIYHSAGRTPVKSRTFVHTIRARVVLRKNTI